MLRIVMIASDNAYHAFAIVVDQSIKLFGIVRAACPTQWLPKKSGRYIKANCQTNEENNGFGAKKSTGYGSKSLHLWI